ncbi:class I SAM-dependent methyltransferase [Streptomyces sp. TRM68416]|uniref:class I SAM-dependent methyltransferase n=1 Tax=Streptomyces sp. TRM68416 TaxID=2758412 RepID=UPI00166217A8|nr:class I SAM-dependent methyltransferase [Streptomyces sp. TRM68416]MBD0839608.1 class I SAM-dependent methyltransferase [Streptomyces sp. TRM68416]
MSIRATVKSALGDRNARTLRRLRNRLTGRPPEPPRPTGLAAISDDLTALAVHFKTDKWGTHRYTRHYQRHLQHLKNERFNLLEIGIGGYGRTGQGGASLRMWKHFFPHAQIFGMDLHDKSFVDEDRITTFVGDQSDPASLNAVADKIGELDVVIDDGSHRSPHVLTTFATLFPRLKDGGIYAVEDTQSSYWPEWMGSEDLDARHTTMGMLKRLTDGLNYEEFVDEEYEPTYTDLNVVGVHFYHNLVIIEKGRNAEGSNKRRVLKQRYSDS